jgi:hypothetical protein
MIDDLITTPAPRRRPPFVLGLLLGAVLGGWVAWSCADHEVAACRAQLATETTLAAGTQADAVLRDYRASGGR